MNSKRLHVAVTLTVLVVACMPLFTVNCIGGHDIAYHLLRIEALKAGILAGKPFLRINMLFFGGMGYGSSLFYPDLLLYIPALFRVCGLGINISYHLFVALCIVLGFASSWYAAMHVARDSRAAIITAVIFTLYQYHIYDIYTRAAVGEFTAAIFVPLVIAGLYDLLYEEFERPWLLGVGMAGVILCHTITAILCVLVCAAAVVWHAVRNAKQGILKGKTLLKLLVVALLVLGITAFYWLPVLEMMSTGAFSSDFYFDSAYEAAKLWEILFNDYNRMGAVIFVLLLAGLLIKKRHPFADLCAVSGIIIALFATSLFPWDSLKGLLGFIQFPWRVFTMTGPLLAFAEGIYLSQLSHELEGDEAAEGLPGRIVVAAVAGVMIVSAVTNIEKGLQDHYSYSDDYFDYKPFTAEVIGGEWLPEAAQDRDALLETSDLAITDKGTESSVTRYKNELTVEGIPQDATYVDVPFIYYKGYAAKDTGTGKELAVTGEGREGVVRVYTDGADSVRVYYKGTALQHTGDAVSAVILAGMLIVLAVTAVRKKKENATGSAA